MKLRNFDAKFLLEITQEMSLQGIKKNFKEYFGLIKNTKSDI